MHSFFTVHVMHYINSRLYMLLYMHIWLASHYKGMRIHVHKMLNYENKEREKLSTIGYCHTCIYVHVHTFMGIRTYVYGLLLSRQICA